jgi:hypothetical protein
MAIWYSALLLAVASIATSAQQAVVLTRLGSHPKGLRKIRDILGKRGDDGKQKPRNLQLFIWQAPLSLLNTSGVMFVAGLIVLVWKSVSPVWIGDDVKVGHRTCRVSSAHFLNILTGCNAVLTDPLVRYGIIHIVSVWSLRVDF